MACPTKIQHFWTIFLSGPKAHPPQKCKFYFYCRLAVSDLTGFKTKNTHHNCAVELPTWSSYLCADERKASQSHSLSQRGSYSGWGGEAEMETSITRLPSYPKLLDTPEAKDTWLGLRFRGPGRRSLGARIQKVSKKSRQSLPGLGSRKSEKKSRKRSEKSPQKPIFRLFLTFRTFFWRLF